MNRLRNLIRHWLGLDVLEARVIDLERHFVTKRDEHGRAVETLADVPVSERKERTVRLNGLSWSQRRQLLESTEGGRLLSNGR